jgi:hypothetical protein
MKVTRLTLGDLPTCLVLPASRGVGMGWQKSAEAEVVGLTSRQRAEPVRASMADILVVLSRSLERGPNMPVSSGRNP